MLCTRSGGKVVAAFSDQLLEGSPPWPSTSSKSGGSFIFSQTGPTTRRLGTTKLSGDYLSRAAAPIVLEVTAEVSDNAGEPPDGDDADDGGNGGPVNGSGA
jgi:hypothetical protein